MMETFDPVPVVDYIGAREVLLSLFYESLAFLVDTVPKEPDIAASKNTTVSMSVITLKTCLKINTVQSRPTSPKAYVSTPQSYHSTKQHIIDESGLNTYARMDDAKSAKSESAESRQGGSKKHMRRAWLCVML